MTPSLGFQTEVVVNHRQSGMGLTLWQQKADSYGRTRPRPWYWPQEEGLQEQEVGEGAQEHRGGPEGRLRELEHGLVGFLSRY